MHMIFEQKYPKPAIVTVPSYNAMMEFFVLTFFRDILRKFISGLLKEKIEKKMAPSWI